MDMCSVTAVRHPQPPQLNVPNANKIVQLGFDVELKQTAKASTPSPFQCTKFLVRVRKS